MQKTLLQPRCDSCGSQAVVELAGVLVCTSCPTGERDNVKAAQTMKRILKAAPRRGRRRAQSTSPRRFRWYGK